MGVHIQDHLSSTEKGISDEFASSQRHLLVGHGDGCRLKAEHSIGACAQALDDGPWIIVDEADRQLESTALECGSRFTSAKC